jgi:glucokinase
MTIRNGVGAGIFYQGNLVRGTHGMAGELGHLTVVDHGTLCRCGKSGCLETLVNQDILYRDYVKKIRKEEYPSFPPLTDSAEIHEGLTELFSLAQRGHREAAVIIGEAATYIGMGIAALLMVIDIPNVIITGHFGPDGTAMIPYIKREVSQRIISGIDYCVEYYPLDRLGFAYGAALLILNDYFTGLGM